MSNFTSRMAFLLGLVILSVGLMSCPSEGSETDPSNSTETAKVLDGILVDSPTKTSYLWGADFEPAGMTVRLLFKDGTEKLLTFTAADKFTVTLSPGRLVLLAKDGYDIEIVNFVDDFGLGNSNSDLTLTVSVKPAGTTAGSVKAQFMVNIAELVGLEPTVQVGTGTGTFNENYYLGEPLLQGNGAAMAAKGIQVKGAFRGKSGLQDLPSGIQLALRLENNNSAYADIGGVQPISIVVPALYNVKKELDTPITVHINNTSYASAIGADEEELIKYIGTAGVTGATITESITDSIGAFNPTKMSFPTPIPSFTIGQHEVTYELWYAVYKWATTKIINLTTGEALYKFSDFKNEKNTGLGIAERGGIAGILPTASSNKYMPVHGIDWIDAIVWCNAYWELLGEINETSVITLNVGYPYLVGGSIIRNVNQWINVTDPAQITFNSSTKAFHLPTETEWEFAARGGVPANSPWNYAYAGGARVDDVAWVLGNSGIKAHAPNETVTKTPLMIATALLYNMSGNVWEWCMTDDASTSGTSSLMFLKRGGAYNAADSLASNNKGRLDKVSKDMDQNTGFRLLSSR